MKNRPISLALLILPAIMLVIAIALTACAPGAPTASLDDEYAVYAALIESRYLKEGVDLIVIRAQTTFFPLGPDVTAEQVSETIPGLQEETYDDFLSVNEEPVPLDPSLDLGFDYTLVSLQDLEEFLGGGAWSYDAFYERFPNSQGLMEFSRVGFNLSHNQALVYVGNQYDLLGGEGYYVLLRKEGGDWLVDSDLLLWVS
jgi:hypothetical protein